MSKMLRPDSGRKPTQPTQKQAATDDTAAAASAADLAELDERVQHVSAQLEREVMPMKMLHMMSGRITLDEIVPQKKPAPASSCSK